jgi:DnaA family protein
MKQLPLDFGLAAAPRLDNFIALGNEAAIAHLLQCVADPMRSSVPTYLWGEAGSGKTHVLRAVASALREQGEPIGWLDPSTRLPAPFDNTWQAVVLDDCHRLSTRQQATAFNWFVNAQTPTQGRPRWVLSAGALPPADLKLREDLRSRLAWGQVHHMLPLDEAERRTVLRRAAEDRGLVLTDEVVTFMLNHFSRDLSSLMQLLEHLDQYALRTQRAITIPLIKSMLENDE